MLLDPAYAATQNPNAFAGSVLALHRELTAPTFGGRAQLPWPRALGTPPWAVARAMTAYAGVPYRTHVVRWGGRGKDFDALHAAVSSGRPCPMYVGDGWLPRHVVLAVDKDGTLLVRRGLAATDKVVAKPKPEAKTGDVVSIEAAAKAPALAPELKP
jgi:hypothetical protein